MTRKASESDDDLMARVVGRPADELAQKVVRSTEIAPGKLTLIGFVMHEDNSEDSSQGDSVLVGHLLIETAPGHYEHVTFPSCEEEGGPPKLDAVFFARTAKGAGRDLGVFCTWDYASEANHGTCYSALFYRVKETGAKIGIEPVTDLKKKFDTCDMENGRGKSGRGAKPTFKTVAGVKKLLAKMGLKQ